VWTKSYKTLCSFIEERFALLQAAFPSKMKRAPAPSTLWRIIGPVDFGSLEAVFRRHAAMQHAALGGGPEEVVAYDGKSLKGSYDTADDRKMSPLFSKLPNLPGRRRGAGFSTAAAGSAKNPAFWRAGMAASRRRLAIPSQLGLGLFEQFVLPHLSVGSRGPAPKLSLHKIFNYILQPLYLGCQWKELPIEGWRRASRSSLYADLQRLASVGGRWLHRRHL
jgi:hypothetical protein